jgi:pullulanase
MANITLLNAELHSLQLIRAELSTDWVGSRMPAFLLEPGRKELVSVRHCDFWEFAETSAYFFDGTGVHFFCGQQILAQNQLEHGDPVFLAGDFNGWDQAIGDSKWQLKPVSYAGKQGLKVSVPLDEFDFNGGTGFKFVTHEGHWFTLPATATNVYNDGNGNSNYFIDRNRSGRHVMIIETDDPMNLSKDYSLILQSQQHESSTAITPGAFFLNLTSPLSLGAFPNGNSTLFRIFAPRASEVKLVLMESPEDFETGTLHSLIQIGDGVWEVVIDKNLSGQFYWYRIDGPAQSGFSHFDPEFNILDPYALAVVSRLGPAIVVDTSSYEKPQWFSPPNEKDLIIGEVHLRDLIAKAPIRLKDKDRLGYAGLIEYLKSDRCYLKEWGVNAVELQPIQEHDAHSQNEYHWGYMTANFFSPESSYARDPLKASQVEEFKALVNAFHEAGLAVILDVVYNHVGEPAHLLFIDKLYYFELSVDGTLSNWSGCGNDLRCSTPMTIRLITDSLLHFIEFYGVDGFRFDLAELIGLDSLHKVEATVKEKHPDVILIAEPWSFRGHMGSDLKHTSFHSWNDAYRDFVKHYVSGKGDHRSLQYFLRGSPDSVGRPYQSINYTESHDDRTWLDDITQNPMHNGYFPTPLDRRRTHLMASILMMSLGTPMLAQGQDFLRSKWGVNNTYQRGDINALDYQRMVDYSGTHSYFRNWVEFRKSELGACLRLDSFPDTGFFEFFPAKSGGGLGILYNASETVGTHQLLFAVNPVTYSCLIEVQGLDLDRNWIQLADSERFVAEGLSTALTSLETKLKMPPVSCALWIS